MYYEIETLIRENDLPTLRFLIEEGILDLKALGEIALIRALEGRNMRAVEIFVDGGAPVTPTILFISTHFGMGEGMARLMLTRGMLFRVPPV